MLSIITEQLKFRSPISRHHCHLFPQALPSPVSPYVLVFTLFLPEGRAGEAWKRSIKWCSFLPFFVFKGSVQWPSFNDVWWQDGHVKRKKTGTESWRFVPQLCFVKKFSLHNFFVELLPYIALLMFVTEWHIMWLSYVSITTFLNSVVRSTAQVCDFFCNKSIFSQPSRKQNAGRLAFVTEPVLSSLITRV
jgi:hypothetical protein